MKIVALIILGPLIYVGTLLVFAWAVVEIWVGWDRLCKHFGWTRRPAPPPHTWTDENTSVEAMRALVQEMARPMLLLEPTDKPSFSKIGGGPSLGPGMRWPIGVDAPRAFVMQLDLAAVRSAGGPDWLPEAGALYAFLDEEGYGFGDEIRVRYSPALGATTKAFPEALPKHQRFKERPLGFQPATATPSSEWLDLAYGAISEELDDELGQPSRDNPDHRLGGYPAHIQSGRLALECEHLRRGLPGSAYDNAPTAAFLRAAESWRLLLQIDAEPDLGIEYGDGGMFYVFIREQDARKGDFSKTITIPQTS